MKRLFWAIMFSVLCSAALLFSACNVTPAPAGPHAVSGTITGASIVYVQLSGTASSFTSTSSTGYYRFTGLEDGYYIVTPSKTGYTFTPHSRTVTVASADATGVNFDVQTAPDE